MVAGLAICGVVAMPATAQSLQDEFNRLFARQTVPATEQPAIGHGVAYATDEGAATSKVSVSDIAPASCCETSGGYLSDHHGGITVDTGCCDTQYNLGACSTDCCEPCCVEPWAHRDGVWVSYLYLHAVGADMHYAQQQNGTGGAGTVPFGEIGVTDPDWESGYRIGGALACNACSSVSLVYTYYDSDSVSTLDAPAIAQGTVGSLVHHPGTAVTASVGPVGAEYTIKFQTVDADYRRLFMASSKGWANYSIGGRYTRLEQNFFTQGIYAGAQGGNILTGTELDFDGGGLKVGLDGERLVGRSGLSFYGNTSASALVGSFRGDYRMHNATTVTDLAIVRWEDDRVVPMLEYEVGVAWTDCSGCCRVSLGYTAMHWFNTVTTPEFVDAVQADNYTDFGDTLSFSGLTSKFEFRY